MRSPLTTFRSVFPLLTAFSLVAACGGSSAGSGDGGAGGTAGTAGSGTGGMAAGGTGAAAGSAGSSGSSGSGGAGAAGASGSSGASGSAGASGSGAVSGEGGVGGIAGSAGAAGNGGTGGVAIPECAADGDCAIVDDCCSCLAIPSGDPAPTCDVGECFAPTCAANGIDAAARCVAGRCVLDVSCDRNQAVCFMEPPDCGDGRQPVVEGGCFGGCVATSECAAVTSCDDCGDELGCVINEAHLSTFHCATPASGCQSDRSCGCFGTTVCVGAFDACSEAGDRGVRCGCPAC